MHIYKKSINEEIIYAHRYYTEPANHIFLYYKDHYFAQHSLFHQTISDEVIRSMKRRARHKLPNNVPMRSY